jgi:hypothetical protein
MFPPLQDYGGRFQCKLIVLSDSEIQFDRLVFVCSFTGTLLERDCEIIFPFAAARRARIISNHRRTTLPEHNPRCECETNRDRKSSHR